MRKVVEYDKDFKEIWSFDASSLPAGERFSAWAAIRLKNGNTLITNEAGKSHIEVTPDKKIVWQIKPEDLPAEYRYINTQSCTRLANGNTIICSRGANGKGPQLIEVTPEKKVVWVLEDWADLGPATAVQILDDPGVPENPGRVGALNDALHRHFAGVVAGADKRSAGDTAEAHRFGGRAQFVELVRRDVAHDGQVVRRRL